MRTWGLALAAFAAVCGVCLLAGLPQSSRSVTMALPAVLAEKGLGPLLKGARDVSAALALLLCAGCSGFRV